MYKKYLELREQAGVTDYVVSKNTGVSTATLTNWKYGRYTPKVDKLKKIADFLGVPLETLLEEETEETENAKIETQSK